MKKLLLFVLVSIMFLPIGVFAEEKVPVYVFRGEGCPHCEEFLNYIKGLDSYKDKITIKDYEIWFDENNQERMYKVAYMRKDKDATGVPYIIIGDKSWIGYSSDNNKEIEAQIDKVYNQSLSDRYDVMDEYNNKKDTISKEDYYEYFEIDPSDESEDDDYDYDDYSYCEDEGYVTEDTMVGAAILAFVGGLAVAGIPLIIVIVVLSIVLIKKKRNG